MDASDAAMAKLEAKLLAASENGKHPIVCDTSPCLKHVKDHVRDPLLGAPPPSPPGDAAAAN